MTALAMTPARHPGTTIGRNPFTCSSPTSGC